MKRFLRKIHYGEKGFTLVELLVVVAILGVLAAVAVPNVGKFIGKGKSEAYETELHNIQTSVMAMLADSAAGVLDTDYTGVYDLDDVYSDNATLSLSDYLTGLNTDGTIKTYPKPGITYDFDGDGTVTQNLP